MSIRRKILILIATAFAVTCAIVFRWNSDFTERQEVWVALNAGRPLSLDEANLVNPPQPLSNSESGAAQPQVETLSSSGKPFYSLIEEVQDRPVLKDLPLNSIDDDLSNTVSKLPTEGIREQPKPDSIGTPRPSLEATTSTEKAKTVQLPAIKPLIPGTKPVSAPQNQKIKNPFFQSSAKSNPPTQSSLPQPSSQPKSFFSPSSIVQRNNIDFIPAVPPKKENRQGSDFELNLQDSDPLQLSTSQGPSTTKSENKTNHTFLAGHVAAPAATHPSANELGETTPDSTAAQASTTAPQGSGQPAVLQNATNFVLAEQPKQGAHWKDEAPVTDSRAVSVDPINDDFSPTPGADSLGDCQFYDPYEQQQIYEGKTLNAVQRPLLELGRPWYQLGQLNPPSNLLGSHNPIDNQFIVFGDFRSGLASNSQNGNSSTLSASQLNLNFDWKITSTERFHMFVTPLTKGLDSTGYLFDEDRFLNNTNANIPFGYFEGDLGAMVGGLTKKTYPFDLPFAVGVIPLLFQNGVWMEDNLLGFAFTIPSRNSARLDISNMDITFFAGYDKMNTDALPGAFPGDNSAGKVYGIASFIEAWNGYVEADYAFVEDRTFLDRSYHNLGLGYTRRFGRFVSNSTRAIVNLGQDPSGINQTADGWLLLSENSLISGAPSTVVPYFNLFAGFDRPQSVSRNGLAGGVLRNTGILFESDNLTRYPTLDASANNTYGAALGLNLLASDFSQQLILETAFASTMGPDLGRNAVGNQYGLGARYQLPLTNSLILRTDLMYGFFESTNDSHGARIELRRKF